MLDQKNSMQYKKITTLLVLLATFARACFRSRANRVSTIPPKSIIAMVLTSNVGDMIFATSVFRAIKEKYPDCRLIVVGSKKNAITLSGNGDVDEYIATPASVWKLIGLLSKEKADYGFTLALGSFDIASMFLAGVPAIACFDVKNAPGAHTRSYNLLKKLCIQVPYYIGKYCSQEYLRILEPINIFSTNTSKYLFYDEETAGKVRKYFLLQGVDIRNEKIAAISPGAGTKAKLWPAERFAKAADYLAERGFKIAVIGGPGDKEEIELFKSKVQIDTILDASSLSLKELFYFISACKLLMANDSGPVYMAESFHVPTFVVVGPTDEFEHPPHGPRNAVVTPNREEGIPEMRGHIVGYSEERAREQINKVTVEQVLQALEALLQKI
ncbi:glycosyltransferase family 9 protein [bacterium]|nr:glycosyltransferase family 9 protein [bacterium]